MDSDVHIALLLVLLNPVLRAPTLSQAWWHTLKIPASGKLRQGNQKF
jgi:hypothetical protein